LPGSRRRPVVLDTFYSRLVGWSIDSIQTGKTRIELTNAIFACLNTGF
jgi:hypothetical protein